MGQKYFNKEKAIHGKEELSKDEGKEGKKCVCMCVFAHVCVGGKWEK